MSYRELEDSVMDLHEQGIEPAAIAQQVGRPVATVNSIIGYMQLGRADILHSPLHLGIAGDKLVAAIARHHPEKVSI